VSNPIKSVYETIVNAGYQISPEAFAMLGDSSSPVELVERLLREVEFMPERPLIIERSHLEGLLEAEKPVMPAGRAEQPGQLARPPADIRSDIRVISGSEGFQIEGTAADFKAHFMDRFSHLQRILKSRGDLKDATGVSAIPDGVKWRKVKVIGMVMSKRDSKSGVTSVVLEDTSGSVDVVLKGELKEKASRLLMDEVVCVTGATKNGRTVIANDVIWPDISPKMHSRSNREDAYVVMTSDTHIGSKLFMKENFESFLKWLRGENGTGISREIAMRTKYLIVAGDVVDGVGVYPNQEEELSIKDLYKQYEQAAEYFSMVPSNIKIIIIPGNHDACRPTLPSPPIYREFAGPLYAMKNVIMLGDPAMVSLDGVSFLLTHGRSLDDTIPSLPNCSFKDPQKAMVELLKSRHISPIYGEKTPLAPEHSDSLVIDPVPDVFQAGHVHVWGVTEYRGVIVANSGTWQAQTNYQLSMGIEPKPAVVPVLNLSSFRATTLSFA
jgi:DNA polymerase II small subunit